MGIWQERKEHKRDASIHRAAVGSDQFARENRLMKQQGLTQVYESVQGPPPSMPRLGTGEFDKWLSDQEAAAQEQKNGAGQARSVVSQVKSG